MLSIYVQQCDHKILTLTQVVLSYKKLQRYEKTVAKALFNSSLCNIFIACFHYSQFHFVLYIQTQFSSLSKGTL